MYIEQLTELLTRYGSIHEVWFDGANGEGPNGKRQVYDWPRTWATVRRLQPEAVMFSDAGPDVRWIGNERGAAGTTNWSTVDPRIVTAPGMGGDEVMRSLQGGDRDGTVWRPGEADVSIRPGWFHHAAEDARPAEMLLELPTVADVGIVDLREDITKGQRVARYRLDASGTDDGGAWRTIARGTTIGFRRLERVEPSRVQRLRLTIEDSVEFPDFVRVGCFSAP